MFKIENNIPIPEEKPTYPVAALEVGQSILFPVALGEQVPTNAASYYRRKLKRSYTVRRMEENGEIIGWRLWRVK
jgi:hypothetical protein